jgi:hypothetical protein
MLAERHPVVVMLLVAVVAIAVIIGAQGLATAYAPPVSQSSQGAVIGQAGFAYLGGLRMMGAGLLWGRLDAQFHQYGSGAPIQDRLDLLPSIRMVQLLNPQLELPYYYTSYMLYLRGDMRGALSLALEGIRNNPTSGLLRANYTQLLMIQDKRKNLPLMLQQSKIGLSSAATYNSIDDQYQSFAIFRTVYKLAGDTTMVNAINDVLAKMQSQGAGSTASASGGGLSGILNAWTNSAVDNGDASSGPATSTTIVK